MIEESLSFVDVCSLYQPPEEKDLADFGRRFDTLDFPDELDSSDIYFNTKNMDDFEFTISNGEPAVPDSGIGRSVFHAATREVAGKKGVHVHSYIQKEFYDCMIETHNSIAEMTGTLQVNHSSISLELSSNLDELEIGVEADPEWKLSGIEFAIGDGMISLFYDEQVPYLSATNWTVEEDINDVEQHIEDAKAIAKEAVDGVVP